MTIFLVFFLIGTLKWGNFAVIQSQKKQRIKIIFCFFKKKISNRKHIIKYELFWTIHTFIIYFLFVIVKKYLEQDCLKC